MKDDEIKVWDEEFAIVKSNKMDENAFAIISDDKEITLIIDKNKVNSEEVVDIDLGWKLITINIVFDFDVLGVISKISSALANKGIALMTLSSYSRDHILIKEDKLNETIGVLKEINLK